MLMVVRIPICALIGISSLVFGESHSVEVSDSLTDNAILVEIKEQLVIGAQAAETNVVNTSWLDGEGRLHESTVIRSKVRVRGVQVKRYLEEMNRPRVEIALDKKMASLPECFIEDDHLMRTVVFEPVLFNGRFDIDQFGIISQIVGSADKNLRNQLSNSSFWSVLGAGLDLNPYLEAVTGFKPTVSQYSFSLTISPGKEPLAHKAEKIPGSDIVSTYFNGSPSWFGESWVRISASLKTKNDENVIWSNYSDVRIPARRVEYGENLLSQDMQRILISLAKSWGDELVQYARCEPIHFNVAVQSSGKTYQIDGGIASGIKIDDRLLLIDRETVPKRALDPGALSDLTLWKVIHLDENSASIERTAGPQLKQIGGKVALPF